MFPRQIEKTKEVLAREYCVSSATPANADCGDKGDDHRQMTTRGGGRRKTRGLMPFINDDTPHPRPGDLWGRPLRFHVMGPLGGYPVVIFLSVSEAFPFKLHSA